MDHAALVGVFDGFGDLTHEESEHSLSMFTAKVMPEFSREPAHA